MKTVISASRRTDLPAHYLDRLIAGVRRGWIDVPNPVSGRLKRVSLLPEEIHTIVLWSKDFSRFIEARDEFEGFNLYFLFTLNDAPLLEPRLPTLSDRIAQAYTLSKLFGPERIAWRFDPVVLWAGGKRDNTAGFRYIARSMASAGIGRCHVSFVDLYRKVLDRTRKAGMEFYQPSFDEKATIASGMAEAAGDWGIEIFGCCEPDLTSAGILRTGGCRNGRRLSKLAAQPCSLAADRSQRPDCRCTRSVDIGDYRGMPCYHSCLYCYANPAGYGP